MAIILRSDMLEVHVVPERGADIVQIVDLESSVPVLACSATGEVTSNSFPTTDSQVQWINGYPGGWQLLAPNAGPARMHDGVVQGFHGEASLAQWTVLAQTESTATLETILLTAPLHLQREVVLDGARLSITDTVTNRSPDPTSTRLVQHPAFGAPFLDDESYLITDAATLISDAEAPGTKLEANQVGSPSSLLAPGPIPGTLALAGPDSRDSLFAALTDFGGARSGDGIADKTSVTFASPTHGFGMRLEWAPEIYPHAWFWIEANATPGWPWYRQLYAVAVEPANILPGEGQVDNGRLRGGPGVEIGPGQTLVSTVILERVPLVGK